MRRFRRRSSAAAAASVSESAQTLAIAGPPYRQRGCPITSGRALLALRALAGRLIVALQRACRLGAIGLRPAALGPPVPRLAYLHGRSPARLPPTASAPH